MMKEPEVDETLVATLERFVVLMYQRTSELSKVDMARQKMFPKHSKALENIPPTAAALRQHILRAAYQCGYIWGQSLVKEPPLSSPSNWGWQREDGKPWRPVWTTLPQAQDSCYELIRCGCKQGCRGRCTCLKANLQCTGLCFCGGDCSQDV